MDRRQDRRSGHAAELIASLPAALLEATSLDAILTEVARRTMAVLGYEDCVIYLTDEHGHLIQRAAWGPKSPGGSVVDPLNLRFGEGIVGRAALTKRVQIIKDTELEPDHIPDVGSGRSELAVPILFSGEVLGVIDSEHSEPGFYSTADADVISTIAAMAAARIDSAITTMRLIDTVTELNRTQIKLKHAADTDALTATGNRRAFERHLNELITAGVHFGLCAIDLDGFKEVNDVHGHHAGDQILIAVADLLRGAFGELNASLARIGGDEFVVVAPFDRAYFTAKTLEVMDELQLQFEDIDRDVTMSAGIAFGSDEQTWRDADDALFVAKAAGGNQLRIFAPDDPELTALRRSRKWSETIRRSLTNGDLCLFAQRIEPVCQDPTDPGFYELLLRHRGADGRWQPPGELLAAAGRFGLEREIDAWVLDQALDLLADPPPALKAASVSVNWSVRTLQSPEAIDNLIARVQAIGFEPQRLVIEITEHASIDAPGRFGQAVGALRSAGIRVAIDDLGSGWTSLNVLRENPVDFLKLDGDWVRRAKADPLSRLVVRSMIESARLLGATTIAESVEDEATMNLLTELGVGLVQGWFRHRPEPLEGLRSQNVSVRVTP